VLELLTAHHLRPAIQVLGVPDRVFDHASQGRLREQAGLTHTRIAATARALLVPAPGSGVAVSGGVG
jgi:deoxyxylulose-5-phosphate synthase